MDKEKMKETLRVSGKTMGLSLLIYAVILIFKLGYLGIILLLTAFIMVLQAPKLYNHYRELKTYGYLIKTLLETYLIISLIYLLSMLLGPYGFWGTLLIVLLIATYKIIKHWKQFVQGLQDIETSIWGKPLNKKNWENQKLPKVQLTFKKGKRIYTGENMKQKKHKPKALPPVLCWIALVTFMILGGLAITENILTALIGLHSGLGLAFFLGYLFAALVATVLAYIIPIVMMGRYIKFSRRYYGP